MSIYRKADGTEFVVCDGCGATSDGSVIDATTNKVDMTAAILAAGAPQGTELDVTDLCPCCGEDDHASPAKIEPDDLDVERAHLALQEQLPMWVVHEKPTDYPESFVARMWVTLPKHQPTNVVVTAPSLAAVRRAIPDGLVRVLPDQSDPASIVEVWL